MWTNLYEPEESDWYIVKLQGKRTVLMWNSRNKFWVGFDGRTYLFKDIDMWLDDSMIVDK